MNKLDFLIKYLLDERNDLGNIAIPDSTKDKFKLYLKASKNTPTSKRSVGGG
jgi:hypothetical protein